MQHARKAPSCPAKTSENDARGHFSAVPCSRVYLSSADIIPIAVRAYKRLRLHQLLARKQKRGLLKYSYSLIIIRRNVINNIDVCTKSPREHNEHG